MVRINRLTLSRRHKPAVAQSARLGLPVKRRVELRQGLSLFELVVALFVLTTAMTAIVQLLGVTASQRRTIEQRRVALAEVANQAERIALLSWDDTSPDELKSWQLSDKAKQSLPHGAAMVEVTDESGPVRGRRIRLLVRSPNAAGQEIDLAELSVWKFAPGGEP